MRGSAFPLRRSLLLLAAGALALSTLGASAAQAEGEHLLLFRPHCEKQDQRQCPFYKVEDPTSLGTENLQVGDVLDFDIVLINPDQQPVRKVRTWLSYDTQVLEGSGITLSLGLPVKLPGEAEFDAANGYVKIGASSEATAEPKDDIFPIARVTFRVKAVPTGNKSPLSFYDVQSGTAGHTYVASTAGDSAPNILSLPTASLIVKVSGAASSVSSSVSSVPASSSVSSVSSVSSSGASVASASPNSSSSSVSSFAAPSFSSASAAAVSSVSGNAFGILQVQSVRIGTEGDAVFLGWDPLHSAQVQAYNIYYGTTMGRYIQRRTVSKDSTSVLIRGLPQGNTYYAAIRAVDAQGKETAFSQEVAVQVGNPNTSTAPLLVRPQDLEELTGSMTAPQNPVDGSGNVPGASGTSSGLTLIVVVSAVCGTLLALRRQFAAVPRSRHE